MLRWSEGEDNIEEVETVYRDVTLIIQVVPGEEGVSVYDISKYDESGIIGLTYCVKDCKEPQNGVMFGATVAKFKNGGWAFRD